MTMTKQAGELPQSASCEIPEEQLIGITRELVRCMRVFEGHGAPPRAIWLETLVAECLERLECSYSPQTARGVGSGQWAAMLPLPTAG
jgi:hypothetical protein